MSDRRAAEAGDSATVARLVGARASLAVLAVLGLVGRAARRGAGRRPAPHVPPRAGGVARLPRVRRHRGRRRRCSCGRAPARRSGTASPARRPSSAWCSPALTLVLGSLWGRPVWGIVVGVGRPARHDRRPLLPLPRLPRAAAHPAAPGRAKRCAIAALIAFVDVPIVHFSVDVVAHAPPGGDRLQRGARRRDPRTMAFTLVVGGARVHAALRVPPRPPVPARGARGGPRGARARAGDRRACRARPQPRRRRGRERGR